MLFSAGGTRGTKKSRTRASEGGGYYLVRVNMPNEFAEVIGGSKRRVLLTVASACVSPEDSDMRCLSCFSALRKRAVTCDEGESQGRQGCDEDGENDPSTIPVGLGLPVNGGGSGGEKGTLRARKTLTQMYFYDANTETIVSRVVVIGINCRSGVVRKAFDLLVAHTANLTFCRDSKGLGSTCRNVCEELSKQDRRAQYEQSGRRQD